MDTIEQKKPWYKFNKPLFSLKNAAALLTVCVIVLIVCGFSLLDAAMDQSKTTEKKYSQSNKDSVYNVIYGTCGIMVFILFLTVINVFGN
jgi:hypothetical protein